MAFALHSFCLRCRLGSMQWLSAGQSTFVLLCALALIAVPERGIAADFQYIFSIRESAAPAVSVGADSGRSSRFACRLPVQPMADMSHMFGFYKPDTTRSIIDREAMGRYVKRVWPTKAVAKRFIELIETAVENVGAQPMISRCIVRQLREWANAEALLGNLQNNDPMGHRQAILIALWTSVGLANAYAVATAIEHMLPEDKAAITSWFSRLVNEIVAEFTPPVTPRAREFTWLDGNSNHRYWAAAAVGLLAVHIQDSTKLEWAIDVLHSALAEAEEDGALPRELARGGRALHYQSFALKGLALLVRLADANGVSLTPDEEAKLAAISRFTAEAFVDPTFLAGRAGYEQEKTPEMAGWVDLLLAHFGRSDPELATRLDRIAAPYRPFRDEMLALPSTALFSQEARSK